MAVRLTEGFENLCDFVDFVKDAPAEIQCIIGDLSLSSDILACIAYEAQSIEHEEPKNSMYLTKMTDRREGVERYQMIPHCTHPTLPPPSLTSTHATPCCTIFALSLPSNPPISSAIVSRTVITSSLVQMRLFAAELILSTDVRPCAFMYRSLMGSLAVIWDPGG